MSQLRTNAILDASGGTTATVNGYAPTLSNMAGRNRIINGAFEIWQRGTSFTPNSVLFGADRFAAYKAGASAGDYARSTDVPAGQGFTYSAYFNGTDVRHSIELPGAGLPGDFVSGSVWTLSFWVKAGASSTSTVNIGWADGVSASSLTYWGSAQSYSYSTSWQKVTLTFTVSGTPTGSQPAVLVYFDSVSGLYLTGVQLEAGSIATPFERRLYGDELARCQRYFRLSPLGAPLTVNSNNTIMAVSIPFNQPMRATPSVTQSTTTVYGIGLGPNASSDYNSTNSSFDSVNADASGIARIRLTGLSTFPTANAYYSLFTASKFGLDAEL